MDTKELNINRLCDDLSNYDEIAIQNWKKTSSLLWSHWMPFVYKGGLKNYKIPTDPSRCRKQEFFNSLPSGEGTSICKSLYSNEVVKLTIQIADPNVMEIQKDVSVTFPDMLGIVGELFCNNAQGPGARF